MELFPNEDAIKFVKREVPVYRKKGDEYVSDSRYIIGLLIQGEIVVPHPVTDFLDKKYYNESGSINSEKAVADTLVQFLNYILHQKRNGHSIFKKVRGIADLKLCHMESFLEYCGERGNLRDTVKRKEHYLLHFYYFFGIQKNVLKNKPPINKTHHANSLYDNKSYRKNSTFDVNLYYKKPKQQDYNLEVIKKKDFLTQRWTTPQEKQTIRLKIIREFLLIAKIEFPHIAFAVSLQIFGGLRAAECMNLDINSVLPQNNSQYGEKGLILKIRDRQSNLFPFGSPQSNNQVKRPRDQAVLLDPLVPYLYKKHLDWLKIKKQHSGKNKNEFKNGLALFINNRGEAMQTHTYRNIFNHLKRFYLGMLKNTNGRYEDFKEFRETRWSTHIGRGAFTNLCLDAGYGAVQTAILRGDKSPQAMLDYTDILTATSGIIHAIDTISPESSYSSYDFEEAELNKTWKDVVHFANTDNKYTRFTD
ncbi:hypothetical protein BK709_01025 [Bacillus thuringiensis serovar shandongiensis]|uniref:hypothetical protein n=1 Tax=Bacillus toyonensis TaxID=155322 RepID=UPI000B4331D1|nr:hypothetical protein [Bacillus toyonensis]MEC2390016.1 hypothetical protein [Bacillus toyonensis]OTX31462.1 hypothetical protein BK717_22990 [Bacillus thuringiensis serovar malayensis]OUB11454.1 hypothetical protein BK709_01025 [Bacillus thuringiensis serovar shandongiensis]